LADLYDPVTMPPKLAKAHEAVDRAVEKKVRKPRAGKAPSGKESAS
jgi:hypothetical protein